MEIQEILKNLREKHHLTQEQMAERLLVTRQAVSRWETGETQPNTDTLKLLSREFQVSINTLLGAPRVLFCQCFSRDSWPFRKARRSASAAPSGLGMFATRKSTRLSFVA